jgi:hypothetical protein
MHDIFKKTPIPIGFAPKKFAARMGFVMSIFLVVFYLKN